MQTNHSSAYGEHFSNQPSSLDFYDVAGARSLIWKQASEKRTPTTEDVSRQRWQAECSRRMQITKVLTNIGCTSWSPLLVACTLVAGVLGCGTSRAPESCTVGKPCTVEGVDMGPNAVCEGLSATDNGKPFCSCSCWIPTDDAPATTPIGSITVPVDDAGVEPSGAIAAGLFYSCVNLAGVVKCWGYNEYGMLGDGSNTDSIVPMTVLGGQILAMTANGYSACSITAEHNVSCWGDNFGGQLGQASLTSANAPIAVAGVSNAVQVSMGGELGCALGATGTVMCWGANNYGQTGSGTVGGSPYFQKAPGFVVGVTSAVAVSAGEASACALLIDGTVRCWGENTSGQLGTGVTSNNSPSPVQTSGIAGVKAVSVGSSACALLSDGSVWCWGSNGFGELGVGSSPLLSAVPLQVNGITNATAISVGSQYACAILADTTAVCWGDNDEGMLGNGTQISSPTPVAVRNLNGVLAISAGTEHTCASLLDGSFACWGNNQYGQLGDGTTTRALTPVPVTL